MLKYLAWLPCTAPHLFSLEVTRIISRPTLLPFLLSIYCMVGILQNTKRKEKDTCNSLYWKNIIITTKDSRDNILLTVVLDFLDCKC